MGGKTGTHLAEDRLEEFSLQMNREIEFTFEVEPLELGEYVNGQRCHRSPGSSQISPGWPEPGEEISRFRRQDAHTVGLVKDTDENRQALGRIVTGFCRMSRELKRVLAPKLLQGTLRYVLQQPRFLVTATPAIPEKKPKKKKGKA